MATKKGDSGTARLGQTIRQARAGKLTQPQLAQALADATGDSYQASTISKIEKGTRPLSVEEAAHISRILGISASVMFDHFREQANLESRLYQLSESAMKLKSDIEQGVFLEAMRIHAEFQDLQELYGQGRAEDEREVSVIMQGAELPLEQMVRVCAHLDKAAEISGWLVESLNLDIASNLELDRIKGK